MFNQEKTVRIPKEFVLFGHKYNVAFEDDLLEKTGCYGYTDDDLKIIRLQKLGDAKLIRTEENKTIEVIVPVTENVVIETFFHELVHTMLDSSGEDTLSENERFVNIMGKCLLEIYLSCEYEQDSKQKEV